MPYHNIYARNGMKKTENKYTEFALPFFSVIITAYNRAALLKRALNSLMAQTENDWEAIVIDDGSTDGAALQISSYLKLSNKINFIRQESKGATGSKNEGILLSTGTFITFLDSDDEYSPLHLETRKKILEENPSVEFLYGGVNVIGSQYVPDMFDYGKMIHLSDCVIGGSFFVRRQLAWSLKGFRDMPLGSDADFFNRVNKAGAIIIKTEAPTYIYHRETANSITNNLTGCEELPRLTKKAGAAFA